MSPCSDGIRRRDLFLSAHAKILLYWQYVRQAEAEYAADYKVDDAVFCYVFEYHILLADHIDGCKTYGDALGTDHLADACPHHICRRKPGGTCADLLCCHRLHASKQDAGACRHDSRRGRC